MKALHPIPQDAAPRVAPFLGLIRIATAVRAPRVTMTFEPPHAMENRLPNPVGPRQELRRIRLLLRKKQQHRDDLLVETAALRLWEDCPNEERIPAWVTDGAIRRRLDEIEELSKEIEGLVQESVALGSSMPDVTHGTPSLELDDPEFDRTESEGGTSPKLHFGSDRKPGRGSR